MRVGRHILQLLIAVILLLPACNVTPETPDPLGGAQVVIAPSDTMQIEVGETDTVSASVTGMESGVTYTSSQPAVATVNAATGVVHALAPGIATIIATATANSALQSSVQVTVVPLGTHAKAMSTLINEVCPNEDERFLNDSIPIDSELLRIHEFHDCQRLIRGNQYESLVGIFAHQHVAALKQPSQFTRGRLAAVIVNFRTKREWREYEPLGLAPGTNCLVLRFIPTERGANARGRWEAAIVSAGTRQKPYRTCRDNMDWSDVPDARTRLLEVKPQRGAESPDGGPDAPPVARWDWDESRGVNYLGVRCGEQNWCEIGANGFTPLPAMKTMSGRNMFKGYYDEQFLADKNGALSDVWGTVTPGSDAIRHGRIKRDGTWYETAKIDLRTSAINSPAFAFYTSRLFMPIVQGITGRREGKAILTISSPSGAVGQDWDLLVNGRQLQNTNPRMKFRGHGSDGHNRAATVRWRWNEMDESVWSYCAEAGCCEMAKLK